MDGAVADYCGAGFGARDHASRRPWTRSGSARRGGKTPSEAHRLAEERGLSAQIERQYYSAVVPEGKVLSQAPAPGAVVRRGWELRLALSLGPQRVTIPQIVGQSQRAATITLQQRGLDNSIAEIDLPGATAGQVIGQDPPANALDVAAPKVSLLVTQEISARRLRDAWLRRAAVGIGNARIKDAGFSLGKVTIAPPPAASGGNSAAIPADTNPAAAASTPASPPPMNPVQTAPGVVPSPASIIISQDPAPGRKVAAGSEIRFVVR